MWKLLLIAFMLLASSASRADDAVEKFANLHKIGVVSSIGHTVTLQNVGLMVFSNSLEKVSADDWALTIKYKRSSLPH